MPDLGALAYLIPLLPLLAFVFIVLAGVVKERTTGSIRISDKLAASVSIGTLAISTVLSILLLVELLTSHQGETYYQSYSWLKIGALELRFGWMVDNLTALMLIVVTVVGLMVQIFSLGYMAGESRFPRFYGYLSLFTSAMLILVLANNILELFFAWELMGLTSYLLIGFWFEKDTAKRAAMKAFLVTRVGDVGLFFGMAYLIYLTGTLDYLGLVIADPETGMIPEQVQGWTHLGVVGGPALATLKGTTALGVVAMLFFCGSIGKSAQFPLHVWLPDAMEGPTPVSALIHAATMVAAGVYLVARMYPIFDLGGMLTFAGVTFRPLGFVALIGAITAVMAAYFAFTQNDIKRVLAYSTISQLGYMMIGLGCGGVIEVMRDGHVEKELLSLGFAAGSFHLMTHAFFKGLLFLGSGAVIYACHHEQDMRKMGGLWKLTPVTAKCYVIATLALAGIIPAGLFSKDSILEAAFEFNKLIFAAGVLGAFMTAAYMTRQIIMVFFGEYAGGGEQGHGEAEHNHRAGQDAHEHHADHGHDHQPKEPPLSIVAPLVILAVLAVVSGFVGIPGRMQIAEFLQYHRPDIVQHGAHHAVNWTVMIAGLTAALLGVLAGFMCYDTRTRAFKFATARLTKLDEFVYQLSFQKGWFDEIYRATLVRGLFICVGAADWMDRNIVDGFVNAVGWLTRQTAYLSGLFDRFVVDGLVNLTAVLARGLGDGLRRAQSGQVQTYLLIVFVGLIMLIWAVSAAQVGAIGQ